MTEGDEQRPGLVVEGRHVQLVGAQGKSGHRRVHPVFEQRRVHIAPHQMQGVHVAVRVLAPQLAHRVGDDQVLGVADGDPAGLGGGPGTRRGLGGRAQQRPGEGQELPPGSGELTAPRSAVQ